MLILFTFAADRYISIVYFEISDARIQQLIMFLAITFIFFIYNQLIFIYAKKSLMHLCGIKFGIRCSSLF